MAFGTFTVLCDHYLCLVPRHFHHPLKNPRPNITDSRFRSPQRPFTYSVSMHWPALDTACGRTHTLRLASFTQRAFEAHAWRSGSRLSNTPSHACIHITSIHLNATRQPGVGGGLRPSRARLLWACPLSPRPCWLSAAPWAPRMSSKRPPRSRVSGG